MTYLFAIDRAAIDQTLISLAENRVESLVNIKIKYGIGKSESNAIFKPLKRVGCHCFFLNQLRG